MSVCLSSLRCRLISSCGIAVHIRHPMMTISPALSSNGANYFSKKTMTTTSTSSSLRNQKKTTSTNGNPSPTASNTPLARKRQTSPKSIRPLTNAEVRAYQKDGFVVIKNLFSSEEMVALKRAIETDPLLLGEKKMDMRDSEGKISKLSLWSYILPTTIYGAIAGGARMVKAATKLIQGMHTQQHITFTSTSSSATSSSLSPYHFHTKIMLKEPKTGGSWNIHQDFGYWYRLGCLDPHSMMSCIIAIDKADLENGCLQVYRGSHVFGRLHHGAAGEQAGVDPRLVEEVVKKRCETVVCELEAGDVLFTHSNLLHWSEPNTSSRWRRSMIVAYSEMSNSPFEDNGISPLPNPIHIVDDKEVMRIATTSPNGGAHTTDPAHIAAAGFLDTEANVKKFAEGKEQFKYSTK